MADSNITKKALATALKELMEEVPFDKIQIGQICERCAMNRKSFYYHFKDKYDLLNWIFDTEIITFVQGFSVTQTLDDRVAEIRYVCHYFYDNRSFYRKALKIQGQNSFSEHFREYIVPIMRYRLSGYLLNEDVDEFEVNFFADAAVCAVERWLLDKKCMPPDEFVDKLVYVVCRGAETVHKELKNKD